MFDDPDDHDHDDDDDDDHATADGWWAMMIMMVMMITVTQHIPTMTKSHHGGEVSVMMKVEMCQCQKPTIHHDELHFGVYMYIR